MTVTKEKPEDKGRVQIRRRQPGPVSPQGFSNLRRPTDDDGVNTVAEILSMPPGFATKRPETRVTTGVATGVATPVANATALGVTVEPPARPPQPQSLDTTHSSSEQLVYSIMYRETISRGIAEAHFRPKDIMERTPIRSDRTVRTALDGLIAKRSIEIVWNRNGFPFGPRYRVFEPKEIMRRRRTAGIEVDPQTKKILTPVTTPVTTGDKNYRGTPAAATGVTGVKFTGVNSFNRENSIGDRVSTLALSSSESHAQDDEHDALVLAVREVFERLTGNAWATADELTLAEGKGIPAEVWGMAVCHCVDRAPDHKFARLSYVLEEARRHAEVMMSIPATELRGILRRSVERLEHARSSGEWNPTRLTEAGTAAPKAATPSPEISSDGVREQAEMLSHLLADGACIEDLDEQFAGNFSAEQWAAIRSLALEQSGSANRGERRPADRSGDSR